MLPAMGMTYSESRKRKATTLFTSLSKCPTGTIKSRLSLAQRRKQATQQYGLKAAG